MSDLRFGAVRPDKVQDLLQRLQLLGVREQDLDESFVRSGGRGGQKVNKTSNAVVLKHLPTGLVVKANRERSRAINRYLARRMLAEKLERLHARNSAIESAKKSAPESITDSDPDSI